MTAEEEFSKDNHVPMVIRIFEYLATRYYIKLGSNMAKTEWNIWIANRKEEPRPRYEEI